MPRPDVTTHSHTNIPDKPVVTVVIPSYNSAGYIRECLLSLRRQKTDIPFEIILVDSSDDGTHLIVEKEFAEVSVVHFQDRYYVGAARNAGIERAKGDFIFFLDTDCIAPPNWIEQMHQAFLTEKADGVGGALKNGTPWSMTGTVGFYLEFFRFLYHHDTNRVTPFLIGANCGFRREILKKYKYYDIYDENKVGEDLFFCWRLYREGKTLVFLPSLGVEHLNRTGILRILRYQYKLGRGACYFRFRVSPQIMKMFSKLPFLAFLLPFGTIPWIGAHVFRKQGLAKMFKCISLLPLMCIGNYIWVAGFYRELSIQKKDY